MVAKFPESNTLLTALEIVLQAVTSFRENSRRFYFAALASRYGCPVCSGRFKFTGPSMASCSCGLSFDPTLQFQRSYCCDAGLVKRTLHYACTTCGQIVSSRFLFDEQLFEPEYFRERMRQSREKARCRQAMEKEMLRLARSRALALLDEIDLDSLPSLKEDLDELVGYREAVEEDCSLGAGPSYQQYCRHISQFLDNATLFSAISPLLPDERCDKVHRFVALIFMEHNSEVNLNQMENDILVSRP